MEFDLFNKMYLGFQGVTNPRVWNKNLLLNSTFAENCVEMTEIRPSAPLGSTNAL